MAKVDEEYRKVINEFYTIYRTLQKQHNLRMRSHASIYDDAYIEIYKYNGDIRGERICYIKEEEEIECYRKATEQLRTYSKGKEEPSALSSTVRARAL